MSRNSLSPVQRGLMKMIILRNKNFSENKGDNKSKKDKAINAGLVYGSLGSASYGLSALNSTSKKNRIKLRQGLRDGFKSESLNTLHKNVGKVVLSDEPRLIKEEFAKYGKEQLKEIPKRAADFAKKKQRKLLLGKIKEPEKLL